ncbi:MAG: hypothetical protein GXZ04_06735, partial [Clostridiales bacterium]|nr:hypothetical protein [Clostridiales bacterium]
MSVAQHQQPVRAVKVRKKKWTRDDTELSILALPTSLWYLIFCYLPMFGIILPFLNYKITPGASFFRSLLNSQWAGLDNFKYLFMGGKIWILLRNTIAYNIVFIILGIVVPVTLAIIISMLRNQRGAKAYQTMMFFPHFLSWVVVSYFVFDPVVMEELGIDVSGANTFEALDPIFRKMKEGGIEAPYTMNKGGSYHMLDVYDSAGLGFPAVGVRYDDAERKVVSVLETEDIMANLKQLHTWYKDGIINQDAFTLNETPSELPFYVAQGWPGAWTYTKTNDAGEETKVTGITVPFVGPIFSAGSIMGSMNGIYAGSKNPEKVLQFIELVNTDTKLRDMICYGEEGVNFEYKDGLVEKSLENAWPWARY